MDNKRIFDNYLTNHYSNSEKVDFSNRKQISTLLGKNKIPLDHNLKRLFETTVGKDSAVLDLGCGYGSFLFFLQSHGYRDVTGVDISTEEIVVCKELFESYKFHQADIHDYINTTDKKFDVVYLSHVLEHVEKERIFNFLEKIRDILTDTGIFIIVVPNSAAYFNAAAVRYGDLTHVVGFTDLSLRQTLTVTGFKSIEMRNFYGVGKPWLNPLRKAVMVSFEMFIQILGYDKQAVYTPSLLAIAQK